MKVFNIKSFNAFKKKISSTISSGNSKRKDISKKTYLFIQRKPFTSFFAVLGVFLILMILGNVLFSPKPQAQNNQLAPKTVQIYKIGSAPVVSFQGKVEKSGVVKIVAQVSGIVNNINVFEGQQIQNGTNILSLATNYSGGNTVSIARQIAQDQYGNVKDTYDTQKEIIGKQRDIANKTDENSDKLREIARNSNDQTQALINFNNDILNTLAANQATLEANPPSADNDAKILQVKTSRSQLSSGNNQLQAGLDASKYVNSNDNSPAAIGDISKDITLKQLDLQEKALNLSLEISRLSYNMALVNEANMYPSTPFAGTVNKIFVHVGDNVSSGTPLANISGVNQHVEIVVQVPGDIAKNISNFEPSTLYIGNKSIQMLPTFVSKDAVSGVLYSVIYDLDDSFVSSLTDATYVDVKIPVGVADAINIDPFIPLDSVVQTQEEAYVYIADSKNTARVKKITLGQIQGRYVEVLSGLPKDAAVIIDRNVIEGDKVEITK